MKNYFLIFLIILFTSCEIFEPEDVEKPTLTIEYPQNEMRLSVNDTILVSAYDQNGIRKIKCELSDSFSTTIVEDNQSPFELPVTFIENHNDTISIACEAYDENNNKSEPFLISVYINNDINPYNGYHDGDEIFKQEIIELNEKVIDNMNEILVWEDINDLKRITEIRYRNYDIDSIPSSIRNLTYLSHLEFINNNLYSTSNSMKYLNRLTSLRIQNNNLTEIPEFIGDLINLETIDLSDNYIDSIPNSFSNLGCDECRLKILKLHNNQLNFIDVSPFNFLQVLWLSNNNLTDINLSCNGNIWYSDAFDQLNPSLLLQQNNLCNEPNDYGSCIDEWEIGIQYCD